VLVTNESPARLIFSKMLVYDILIFGVFALSPHAFRSVEC
jgi:hypothetical protein